MKIKTFIVAVLMSLVVNCAQAQDWHIGYNYSYYAPIGFSLGYMPDQIGAYISGKWGTKSVGEDSTQSTIDNISGTSDYEELGHNRNSYTGGVMIGVSDVIALYGGTGYGTYGKAWGYNRDDEDEVKLIADKFAGIEGEIGVIYRGETYYAGIGGIFMNGMNVESKAMLIDISIQFGFVF